eukprot:scaffold310342_cov17-Tisochrysis_lutea.AAC.1
MGAQPALLPSQASVSTGPPSTLTLNSQAQPGSSTELLLLLAFRATRLRTGGAAAVHSAAGTTAAAAA